MGTRVLDETGVVIATTEAPTQVVLVAADANRDWTVVPLPTVPLIGIVTWPELSTRPAERYGHRG